MMDAEEAKFTVEANNFAFSVKEIRVKKGGTVRINLVNTEGTHDWVVDEFDVATERVMPENGITVVEFVADKTGTFESYCSVGNHRQQGMVGTLTVN